MSSIEQMCSCTIPVTLQVSFVMGLLELEQLHINIWHLFNNKLWQNLQKQSVPPRQGSMRNESINRSINQSINEDICFC